MIGFEEVRKYAFAYINTVCQALQGIFFENIGQSDIRLLFTQGLILCYYFNIIAKSGLHLT